MPCLGMLANCSLAGGVPTYAWWSYGIWILVGIFVYFVYGFLNSKLVYDHSVKVTNILMQKLTK